MHHCCIYRKILVYQEERDLERSFVLTQGTSSGPYPGDGRTKGTTPFASPCAFFAERGNTMPNSKFLIYTSSLIGDGNVFRNQESCAYIQDWGEPSSCRCPFSPCRSRKIMGAYRYIISVRWRKIAGSDRSPDITPPPYSRIDRRIVQYRDLPR